jgi:hypothetical protein
MWGQELRHAFLGFFSEVQASSAAPDCWDEGDLAIAAAECRAGALLALDPQKIRWWFRKQGWRLLVVYPYGFDAYATDKPRTLYYPGGTIAVWWLSASNRDPHRRAKRTHLGSGVHRLNPRWLARDLALVPRTPCCYRPAAG